MFDPKFDEQSKACKRRSGPRRRSLRVVTLLCPASMLASLLGIQIYSRRPYTCAVCRANKLNKQLLGLRWSTQEETDCSRWYSAHVEPAHHHVWVPCTYCRHFGIPGVYGGYSCVVGGPLTGLSRKVQIQIYQHFQNPLEAKRLFIQLGRNCPDRIWQALMDWVEEGYSGTWAEWLKRQQVAWE
ncbi:MAG: hypothetical protein ACP5XB_18160 [Isosphaeraceae bacterium]